MSVRRSSRFLTQPAPPPPRAALCCRRAPCMARRYVPPFLRSHAILTFVPSQINDEPIEYLSRCRIGGVTLCRSACGCVRSEVSGASHHRVGTK